MIKIGYAHIEQQIKILGHCKLFASIDLVRFMANNVEQGQNNTDKLLLIVKLEVFL